MSITLDGDNLTTVGVINSKTAQASTSGTSIEFTSIPTGVKRITVLLQGVSTNGANPFLIQLGTSGGYVISGYTSGMGYRSGETTSTVGLLIGTAAAAGNSITGVIPIVTYTTNAWVSSGTISRSDGFAYGVGGSITSLGGTLDRLRIISSSTANPADTFDAGSINILYE